MPNANEKLASQLGHIYVASVMPYLAGTMEIGEMAHVAGYYAGLTYAAAPTEGPVVVTANYRPVWRVRRR